MEASVARQFRDVVAGVTEPRIAARKLWQGQRGQQIQGFALALEDVALRLLVAEQVC